MKATITSIELKTPFKFFLLSFKAQKIVKQLRATNNIDFKNTGFWTKHYAMTLWQSEDDIKKFALSGAHKKAMPKSKQIAKEIRTITVDLDKFPSWPIAKEILAKGKSIYFE